MDECINKNYNPQREVSVTSVTKPKDQVLRDRTNVVNHGTTPKKNNAGKYKDTLATGTSYSPRRREDDLPVARSHVPALPESRNPVHHGNEQQVFPRMRMTR